MRKGYRFLFFAIELNLLMWLIVGGAAFAAEPATGGAWWAGNVDARLLIGGFLLAAIVQHVAYYRLKNTAPPATERA